MLRFVGVVDVKVRGFTVFSVFLACVCRVLCVGLVSSAAGAEQGVRVGGWSFWGLFCLLACLERCGWFLALLGWLVDRGV